MANSTTNLDLISSGQAQKEVTANALFDAGSPAMLFGRRSAACSGLSWGFYGGVMLVSGTPTAVLNGTLTLAANTTNYVQASSSGGVSVNTTGFTGIPLYTVVTGATGVTSYTDLRTTSVGTGGAPGSVTSVALAAPAEFSVSGSPVTGSGTLTFTKANQSANQVWAGPTAGAAAQPSFRSLVAGDIPDVSATYQAVSGRGVANGYAGLDSTGKVPTSQLPAAVLGAVEFQGTWNASTNSPSITTGSASSANKGFYYQVGTAGTTTVDGNSSWAAGDWIISDGTTWDRVNNSTPAVMGASGSGHAAGLVPDPGAVAGISRYLREDGTWAGVAGAAGGTVTSVGISAPSQFSVSGSPVTGAGTLSFAWATQTANLVLAGPISGSAAAPTFRSLVGADLPVFGASGASHAPGAVPDPGSTAGTSRYLREDGTWAAVAGGGSGTVSSVALAAPAEFTVTGSPITGSGTLSFSKANQSANLIYAGPGSGAAAAPAFRALAYADLPNGVPGKPRVQAVTYAASVTLDCSQYDVFEITLTGNITVNLSGGTDGQKIQVVLAQDATGSRTVTWGTAVGFGSDITSTAATATATASKTDYFGLQYNGAATKYHLIAMARGF